MNALADLPPITGMEPTAAAQVPDTTTSTDVAVQDKAKVREAALAPLVALAPCLQAVSERYRAVAFDYKTTKGLQAAKDARHDLRKNGRFLVQNTCDEIKDLLNDAKGAVADKAVELIAITKPREDELHKDIEARESQVKAEKEEAARILAERQQKQAEDVAGIRGYLTRAQTTAGMTAERVANGIKMLEGMTFPADEWLDPVAAANAQCETLEGMRALHATLVAREAHAAQLEAQRLEQARQAQELAEAQAKLKAEQQRVARISAMVQEIRDAATGHDSKSAADLLEARTAVADLDVSADLYQEFAVVAQAQQAATLSVLDKLHAEAVAREDAAAKAAADARHAAELSKAVETLAALPTYAPPPFAGNAEAAPNNELMGGLAPSLNGLPGNQGTVEKTSAVIAPQEYRENSGRDDGGERPAPNTEGQEGRQVLKAEGESPNATDRATPADASPRVGAMGAGQAADAAPAGEPAAEPTLTLGALNEWLAPLQISGAGLELLGFKVARTFKAAKYYNDTDRPKIVAALVRHLQGL